MIKQALAGAVLIAVLGVSSGPALAQTDNDIYPPDEPRSLDLNAFATECVLDAPWVLYDIIPQGFAASPPIATITIRDVDGNVVDVLSDAPLSGRFLYPGAAVAADGTGTDWPGWDLIDGVWIELAPDEGDTILREGLDVQVDVNPTGFTFVTYPAASPVCANPPGSG
ncbi:MAG: hypothetical protein WBP59_11540, partial [Ilumatobacteraceae bacterium]